MKRLDAAATDPIAATVITPAETITTPIPNPTDVLALLGAQIAASIDAGMRSAVAATAGPKIISFTEFINQPGNPAHPSKDKILTRSYVINHARPLNFNLYVLSVEELELLEKITPGRYCDAKVIVTDRASGVDERRVDIVYDNSTVSSRMDLTKYYTDFAGLLKRCIAEAATEGRSR